MVAYGVLLLLSLLEIVICDDVDIMNPTKRCIATATQIGSCHVCMCKTDGVFHCRGIKCDMYKNTTDPSLPECLAHHTYRLDTLFCTCDHAGHWRADRCKRRLYQMRRRTSHFVLRIGTNIECTPQHFYIYDCNICVCGNSGFINFESCTNRQCPVKSKSDLCNPGDIIRTEKQLCACSDINYFIDRLCLKNIRDPIQEVEDKDLDSVIDFGSFWDDLRVKCKAFYTYTIDCSHCFCNENGKIDRCRYKECARRSVDVTGLRVGKPLGHFKALPELNSVDARCKPGIKYKYKCNTCYCTDEKLPICTTMICLGDLQFTLQDLRIREKKRSSL